MQVSAFPVTEKQLQPFSAEPVSGLINPVIKKETSSFNRINKRMDIKKRWAVQPSLNINNKSGPDNKITLKEQKEKERIELYATNTTTVPVIADQKEKVADKGHQNKFG